MWEIYLEWCAEIFGVAVRSKLGQLIAFSLSMFALGLFLSMESGLAGWALPVFMVVTASLVARRVTVARNLLWRVACAPDPVAATRGAPGPAGRTVSSLELLTGAVRALQDGRFEDASRLADRADPKLLRLEEQHLRDTVRATASSRDPEPRLDRAVIARAWRDPSLLAAIEGAWDRAGLGRASLSKLPGLLRIRLDGQRIEEVKPAEAREMSDDARAIGDEELADQLDARARAAAYR